MEKIIVCASTFPRWKDDTNPPFVYELSKRLTSEFEVHVLAPSYPGSKDFERMDNMHVHRFHYFIKNLEKLAGSGGILPMLKKNPLYYFQVPFFMIAEFFALKKLVKKIQPDIIHAHWIIPQGFVAALVNKFTKTPYVVTTHGGDIFGLKGNICTLMKKFTLKNAKDITVVSNAIKKEIHNKIDSSLEVKVISMGVDNKVFNPNKRDLSLRKKYDIKGTFLLFVGRLAEKKGVRYLIEAMPKIIKNDSKTKLMIIGSGVLEAELKQLSRNLGVDKNIIFTGAIQNSKLPKYYATADVFIGPSIITKEGDTEGFGLTFVEAGMSGCWLIGTDVGGISDIIKNGENGVIIKEKSSKDIYKAVISKKIRTIKRNLNQFDWDVVSKKYAEILK